MSDIEQRIRDRAYRLWLEEGCPDGRDKDHWDMATELVANLTDQGEGQYPATQPRKGGARP